MRAVFCFAFSQSQTGLPDRCRARVPRHVDKLDQWDYAAVRTALQQVAAAAGYGWETARTPKSV